MTDLEALFVSRVRINILKLFLSHPQEAFYIREIKRQTEENLSAVRRELNRMRSYGMMSQEWRGNRKYYRFRDDYPFYDDLLSLIAKITGLGKKVRANHAKIGRLKLVFIMRELAAGEELEKKEVGLMVIGNDIVLPELAKLVQEEEVRRNQEIHYTVMTPEEMEYRRKKSDPFLLNILQRPRIVLYGNESFLG